MAASNIKKEGLDFERDRPDLKGTNSTAEEKTEETVCRLKTPWKEASSSEGGGKTHIFAEKNSWKQEAVCSLLLSFRHVPHHEKPRLISARPLFSTRGRGPREGEGSCGSKQTQPEDSGPTTVTQTRVKGAIGNRSKEALDRSAFHRGTAGIPGFPQQVPSSPSENKPTQPVVLWPGFFYLCHFPFLWRKGAMPYDTESEFTES